jgi:ribose transport system substrate-binding protein
MGWKALAALLALVIAAVGTACGSDDGNGDGGGSAAKATPPKLSIYCGPDCQQALALKADPVSIDCKVGVSWNATTHPYGAKTNSRSEEVAKASFPKMELFVADARNDAAQQSSQVDDMVARGLDVLVVSPADAKAIAPAVKRATAEGVKVIASDRSVDGAEVASYIGSDNVEAGEVAGKHIVELLGGKGKVVELQGSQGASPTIDRAKGFRDAIAGTDIEIIGSQAADYDRARGLAVMEDFLQRFGPGEIDLVYTHNDSMSLGAIQAIKEAGRQDEIKIVGIDGQEPALKAVEAGDYDATVVYPLTVDEHMIAAAKLCAGEDIPARIVLESELVTKENAARFEGTTY